MSIQTDILQSNLANKPIVMQDANGVEVGQMCTAWVNFDGTTVTIRNSFNVASVVRNTGGDYTIAFVTPMANTSYVVSGSATDLGSSFGILLPNYNTAKALGSCQAASSNSYVVNAPLYDKSDINVAIFGGK